MCRPFSAPGNRFPFQRAFFLWKHWTKSTAVDQVHLEGLYQVHPLKSDQVHFEGLYQVHPLKSDQVHLARKLPTVRGAAPLLRPRQPLSPSARGTEAFLRPWERDGEMFETSLFEVLTAVPDQRSGSRSR